jgi:hypothetical protein
VLGPIGQAHAYGPVVLGEDLLDPRSIVDLAAQVEVATLDVLRERQRAADGVASVPVVHPGERHQQSRHWEVGQLEGRDECLAQKRVAKARAKVLY